MDMQQVNMHEAKTRLSKLVDDLESGREKEITLARNGRPVARLLPISQRGEPSARIGAARGDFVMPEESPELDTEVAALFVAESPDEELS